MKSRLFKRVCFGYGSLYLVISYLKHLVVKHKIFLNGNMYAKQILTFAILYFVTGFIDTSNKNPLEHLKLSAIIWIIFLLFNKMHLIPTVISFILICVSYLLNDYSSYYEQIGDIETSKKYKYMSEILLKLNIAFIAVSFIVYTVAKYKEYKGEFNILKFIFRKCKM